MNKLGILGTCLLVSGGIVSALAVLAYWQTHTPVWDWSGCAAPFAAITFPAVPAHGSQTLSEWLFCSLSPQQDTKAMILPRAVIGSMLLGLGIAVEYRYIEAKWTMKRNH
jgi:hypothetical protein